MTARTTTRHTPPLEAAPEPLAETTRISTVYGGGGVFGIAYNLGVAEAFIDRGIDLRRAPAIGTSAGAWAAAHLALGLRFEDRFDRFAGHIPRRPDLRSDRLARLARDVFGDDTRCPTVRVGVVALPGLRRRTLHGTDHPIAELVTASSSVPGLVAPHRIDGTRYVDGGIRSMASADLGDDAARLLVVLPMSGPMFGPAGRLLERTTVREIDHWQHHHPGSVVSVVRPSAAVADLVRRPDQLFDPGIATECYHLARIQGAALADAWLRGDAAAARTPSPQRTANEGRPRRASRATRAVLGRGLDATRGAIVAALP